VLETRRLRLREVTPDDASFILLLLNEPGWLRYIGDRGVHTLDDARRYLDEGPRRMYAQHGFGLWLVERREDALPLGLCGLIRRETLPDVDIGFALTESQQGHGYAFEAAAATLDYARDALRLRRVVAIALPDNVASTRLLDRLGLRLEGTIRLATDAEVLNLYGTTAEFVRPRTSEPADSGDAGLR
jgi:RimJ/RimL family protein N-acetyltransferase